MPHILVAGPIHQSGLELLRQAPGVTFDYVEDGAASAYPPLMPKADALLIRTQPLTAKIIASAPRLKFVSRHGVGYDAVDVAALNARDIPLAIVGDVNSRAVAEHTLMLMLAVSRRTIAYDAATRSGNWNYRNSFESAELDGKTLLIFGFGRIGRAVAKLARAFGMTVGAIDPVVPADAMTALGVQWMSNIAEALNHADVVSLHIPLSPRGAVIGAAELAMMKPTAIVINPSRGGLVDEVALDEALRAGRLRGAGLDVFLDEPPPVSHPLLSNDRVTISPHSAGLTEECAARMAMVSARNVLDFFAGKLDQRLIVNG